MERYRTWLTAAASCALLSVLASCGDDYGNSAPILPYTGDGANPTGLIQASDGNFYGTTSNGGKYAQGAFFRVTPTGAEELLYSFGSSPSDGTNPEGVIQGTDGNFYGVTGAGGMGACNSGCGIAFKLTAAGAETVLYYWTGAADGTSPNDLIQGSDGNFYGAAAYGGVTGGSCGPGGCGVLFKLTPSGTESVLHAFTGGTADGGVAGYVTQGSDGNFYGNTLYGGSADKGTIFKVTPAGVETVLYSFAGGNDGAIPQTPLVQGSDGNFYGTTPFGGTFSNGVAFRVTPTGAETVLHAFTGTSSDGAAPGIALIQASDGNFYGATTAGASPSCYGGCGAVFKMTSAGATSALYLFASGGGGVPPNPSGLIQGSDGNFYGTTSQGGQYGFGTLFRLTPAGVATVLYTFGTNNNSPP